MIHKLPNTNKSHKLKYGLNYSKLGWWLRLPFITIYKRKGWPVNYVR